MIVPVRKISGGDFFTLVNYTILSIASGETPDVTA